MRRSTALPRPPSHLSKASKKWWKTCVEEYALEDHDLLRLRVACESWDQLQAARQVLASEGLTVVDRFGQKRQHPAVAIARNATILFLRSLRELRLDLAPPVDDRPPGIANGNGRRPEANAHVS